MIDFDDKHPACARGCGALADECACARRPVVTLPLDDEYAYDARDDYASPCRWRGRADDAIMRGYCDAHYGTL